MIEPQHLSMPIHERLGTAESTGTEKLKKSQLLLHGHHAFRFVNLEEELAARGFQKIERVDRAGGDAGDFGQFAQAVALGDACGCAPIQNCVHRHDLLGTPVRTWRPL